MAKKLAVGGSCIKWWIGGLFTSRIVMILLSLSPQRSLRIRVAMRSIHYVSFNPERQITT